MNWKTMAAAALVLGLAAPLNAQQGSSGMRGPGMQNPRGGEGIEHLLQLRETLELTDDQIARLESLQGDFAEQREAHRAEAEEFRRQVRSGDLSPNEIEERRKTRRESMEQVRRAHRQMVEQLLTEEQRGKLEEIGQVRRRGMRAGARAGFRAGQQMNRGPAARAGMRQGRAMRDRAGLRGERMRPPAAFRAPRWRGPRGR